MKKIISLFRSIYSTGKKSIMTREVTPGAEWVINGEGIATRKWDGTCCLIQNEEYFRRYDLKKGRDRPHNFIPAQDPDEITGHWPGWIPVEKHKPENKYHMEALRGKYEDGTYELIGPKINGNPEGFLTHILIPHGKEVLENVLRTFDGLQEYFIKGEGRFIEGIVWHHEDGRMVKIKGSDFGYTRIK